ncbi:6-phosphogluconolactonase [Legionella beliardensis]|uniref:6-phosphogluconolactonase n=2 Tax=Legionella beliardensis TaxID=91822 RepID=A0A378I0J8_9GAMM|nr:6-phosphogluconolactonase [Legionella beliardensis]STX28708.1 6-phosphogluconolactonase [Legionella beliardensis]
MHIQQFNDTDSLNDFLCKKLQAILAEAIKSRGQAYLVVSGGKTPAPLFKQLSEIDLEWDKVTILLADERWLPSSSEDSNEGMLKRNLLINKAKKASYISLLTNAESPYQGVPEIQDCLSHLPQFDVVILGMGEDGHTASLFPCSNEIEAGLTDLHSAVIAVTPTTAPYERISLTKNRLINSRFIFLHLVGENKLAVLKQAMAGQDATAMPIRAFLHHPSTDVQVMFAPQ